MTKNNFLLLKLKKLIKALVYIVLYSFYLEHMGLFKVFQEHLKNYISTHFNPIFGLQLQRHFFIFWKAFVLYTYYGLPECFNLWFFFTQYNYFNTFFHVSNSILILWQKIPGQWSLAGYGPWCYKESDMVEKLSTH